jgi:hypothetical protein
VGVWEPAFVAFGCLFFLIPFTLKSHNFFNFIPFLTIFNEPDALVGRVQVLL